MTNVRVLSENIVAHLDAKGAYSDFRANFVGSDSSLARKVARKIGVREGR